MFTMLNYYKNWLAEQKGFWSKAWAILWTFFAAALVLFMLVALFIGPKIVERGINSGDVLVYSDNDNAKNYKLPIVYGDVIETSYFLWFVAKTEYRVYEAEWPNGGTLDLDGCRILKGVRTSCKAESGTLWVEDHNIVKATLD